VKSNAKPVGWAEDNIVRIGFVDIQAQTDNLSEKKIQFINVNSREGCNAEGMEDFGFDDTLNNLERLSRFKACLYDLFAFSFNCMDQSLQVVFEVQGCSYGHSEVEVRFVWWEEGDGDSVVHEFVTELV
jgi:hypothetical protein